MGMAKVWNKNIHDLNDKYKGEKIFIPAGKFILMEATEADDYLGRFPEFGIKMTADGGQDPKSYKMLVIEKLGHDEYVAEVKKNKCMACGWQAQSSTELDFHAKEQHWDQVTEEDKELIAAEKVKAASTRKTKAASV